MPEGERLSRWLRARGKRMCRHFTRSLPISAFSRSHLQRARGLLRHIRRIYTYGIYTDGITYLYMFKKHVLIKVLIF